MTNKDLLKRAAKAAKYEVVGLASRWIVQGVFDDDLIIKNDQGGDSVWNPLRYDGDALRLAVKLRINIIFDGGFHHVGISRHPSDICRIGGIADIRYEIVLAAAEIGGLASE